MFCNMDGIPSILASFNVFDNAEGIGSLNELLLTVIQAVL